MRVKTIDDYYEQIALIYPEIPLSEIKTVLLYGFRSFYRHATTKGDIFILRYGFWMYCGQLYKDSLAHFDNYIKKLARKIRLSLIKSKTKWNGYFYFGLSEERYQEYLSLKRLGLKEIPMKDLIVYKWFEECRIDRASAVALFKVRDVPYKLYTRCFYKDIILKDELLIKTRPPLTFKDVLTDSYKINI